MLAIGFLEFFPNQLTELNMNNMNGLVHSNSANIIVVSPTRDKILLSSDGQNCYVE